jgi:quinol monooxygenase YgiN
VIIVTGHVRLAPHEMNRIRPHMRTVLEATRREPGCLLYAYGEDVLEAGLLRIVERWRDWPSLEAHGASPHVLAWRAALKEVGVVDREVIAHVGSEARTL